MALERIVQEASTRRELEKLATTDRVLLLAAEWSKVIDEIGNTNSDHEIIASMLIARRRLLAQGIEV